jgi:DNA-binding LacI/PurR family transcriptional regulator
MKKVTSRDVAKAANVSQSLVSRVFSNKGRVGEKTRERILAAAKDLGWTPNALAAGVVTGKAPLVAVVTSSLQRSWRAKVMTSLMKGFTSRQLKPLVFYAESDAAVNRVVEESIGWQTRGVVVTAGSIERELAQLIIERGQFLVAFNRPSNHERGYSITTDNLAGGSMAAKHMVAERRKRFLVLAGPIKGWATSQRLKGFDRTLRSAGRSCDVWDASEMSHSGGRDCGTKWLGLKKTERPDAVFSVNDTLALGFLEVLREAGIAIPDDVSLIGFDNLPAAAWGPYRLTTMEQPLDEMIEKAFSYIGDQYPQAQIETAEPMETERCAPVLVPRETTLPL